MVQKDQGQHSKQDFLQKFHTTKQEIQFKMTFLKQKTSNTHYLQLLRGYAIINIHKRASGMCYLLPKEQIQKNINSGCYHKN